MVISEVRRFVPNDKSWKEVFPHLGVYRNGEVVLFTSPGFGFLVFSPSERAVLIGQLEQNWDNDYELFKGEAALRNG